jgi:hypothetical protein
MRRGHNEANVTTHQVDKVLIRTWPAGSQIRVYMMLHVKLQAWKD